MTKEDVLSGLKAAWKKERQALAVFLRYLGVVDRERLYLEEAYSSLERFLREGLGLSKSSALKRICAARLISRFPRLLESVEAGTLHLTSLVMLSPHLTEENVEELSSMAQGLSESTLEWELAKRFPGKEKKKVSKITWTSEEEATLVLTVPASLVEKLERVKELRKKAHPDGDLPTLILEALDSYLDRIDPLRKKPSEPKRESSVIHSRRIPQRIQTEIWHRDHGQCTYASPSGQRCNERATLEIDHRTPWAHGGSSLDTSNLRLLCRAHNLLLARKTFGAKVPSHRVPSRPMPGS